MTLTSPEFLDGSSDLQERELERSLLGQLRNFLLKLGKGFAFAASQHRLEVAGQRNTTKPVGVAGYQTTSALPPRPQADLPTPEDRKGFPSRWFRACRRSTSVCVCT